MTYSVYQHWDPLRVCVVGRSYPPEFYSWIKSAKLRGLFERIAIETEEDYQKIISTLTRFNVEIIRPNVPNVLVDDFVSTNNRIPAPVSMNPRDQMIMIGKNFFLYPYDYISTKTSGRLAPNSQLGWNSNIYNQIKGPSWPQEFSKFDQLPQWVQEEVLTIHKGVNLDLAGTDIANLVDKRSEFNWWQPIIEHVNRAGNKVITNFTDSCLSTIPANGITRVGKDLYFGVDHNPITVAATENIAKTYFSDYRCHFVTTSGHIDGCFTPIKPGLIVSIRNIDNYKKTFPGWEVVYLKGESWSKMKGFLELKAKNYGRWWIKDYENDDEVTDFVETWLRDWTGYAEESVFDVNILVIDEKNIIVNGYNKQAFDAFDRHGVTAHICPVRHRYFWDGGVHCITLDLDREGSLTDFFPGRNNV